jgi:uncharacterized membrane protein
MSLYEIALFIHITAVVLGFGATFAEAVLFPVAIGMDPRYLPYVHRVQMVINKYLASPAILIILLTGVYQVIEGNWDFGSFWISASFLVIFILGAVQGAYFIPEDRKLEAMVSREIAAAGTGPVELSDEYLSRSRREGMLGGLAGLLIVGTILLMVWKPGA